MPTQWPKNHWVQPASRQSENRSADGHLGNRLRRSTDRSPQTASTAAVCCCVDRWVSASAAVYSELTLMVGYMPKWLYTKVVYLSADSHPSTATTWLLPEVTTFQSLRHYYTYLLMECRWWLRLYLLTNLNKWMVAKWLTKCCFLLQAYFQNLTKILLFR